jgi:hypothetical protein
MAQLALIIKRFAFAAGAAPASFSFLKTFSGFLVFDLFPRVF